jgi:hypothetical protein
MTENTSELDMCEDIMKQFWLSLTEDEKQELLDEITLTNGVIVALYFERKVRGWE